MALGSFWLALSIKNERKSLALDPERERASDYYLLSVPTWLSTKAISLGCKRARRQHTSFLLVQCRPADDLTDRRTLESSVHESDEHRLK